MKFVKTSNKFYAVPTDMYFADLSGDWDLDGDEVYGEFADDSGAGGWDLTAEVWAGRIPFYGSFTDLDSILQKVIDYQTETGDFTWRHQILLPDSFSDTTTDFAYMSEYMDDDFLSSNGYTTYKMYEQGECIDDSQFASNEELKDGTTIARWKVTDYGLVTYAGHGSFDTTIVGHDDGEGHRCGTLMSSASCSELDDDHPAIVMQCSCSNAYPEDPQNLTYSFSKNGAIGAIGASGTAQKPRFCGESDSPEIHVWSRELCD